jgi:hypothetical protein
MSYIRKGFKLFKLKFWNPVQEEAPLVLDLKRLLKLKFWNPVQEETLVQYLKLLPQIEILEPCSGGDPGTVSETAASN